MPNTPDLSELRRLEALCRSYHHHEHIPCSYLDALRNAAPWLFEAAEERERLREICAAHLQARETAERAYRDAQCDISKLRGMVVSREQERDRLAGEVKTLRCKLANALADGTRDAWKEQQRAETAEAQVADLTRRLTDSRREYRIEAEEHNKAKRQLAEAQKDGERLDQLAKQLSHTHAVDGKHYWYHRTDGKRITVDGLADPTLRAAIDARAEGKGDGK